MAKENETIADIIAAMRGDGHTGPADALEWVRIKLEHYADRLEAAHKREIDGLKKQVGNAAKLRKAIDYLCERMADMDATFDPSEVECLRAALAAPPRNGDVGTAKEQTLRFKAFCNQHDECMGENCTCPLLLKQGACELLWMQMPYEEGGAK